MAETTDNLAVLIDADNAHAPVISELLVEVAQYGTATVKRAYGDWIQLRCNSSATPAARTQPIPP